MERVPINLFDLQDHLAALLPFMPDLGLAKHRPHLDATGGGADVAGACGKFIDTWENAFFGDQEWDEAIFASATARERGHSARAQSTGLQKLSSINLSLLWLGVICHATPQNVGGASLNGK
jgi:hypothetical protein